MPRNEFFAGWSVDALLNLDFEAIDLLVETEGESALRNAVTRIASAANKRRRSLIDAGYGEVSPAMLEAGSEPFTAKGKSVSELKIEFFREKLFMESPTGTVRGAREWWNIASGQNRKSQNYVLPPRAFDPGTPEYTISKLIAILAKEEYRYYYQPEEWYEELEIVAKKVIEAPIPDLDAAVEAARELLKARFLKRFGDVASIEYEYIV